MMRLTTITTLLIVFMVGCQQEQAPPPVLPDVSPGPPRHFDLGNIILKNQLPEDMADGYLEFGRAPDFSYGMTLVNGRLSARSHRGSDMLIYTHVGNARFNVGEKSLQGGTGDVIFIPRGAIYSAYIPDEGRLQLLTIYSPPLNRDDIEYHERAESDREGVDGSQVYKTEESAITNKTSEEK